MNKKEEVLEKQKKLLKIISIIIVVLIILLVLSRNFGSFNLVRLKENEKTIFSISDLIVDDIKYMDSEKEVIKKLGKPKKEEIKDDDIYTYKLFYYDGLIVKLKENYDDYIVVKVEISKRKYKSSRNIKIGDNILDVMNKYKVENKNGTYIYGNYSTDALNSSEIKENIYLGVRSKNEVVYINKDAKLDNEKSNIARLNISYRFGKVKKITWSYDLK